MTSSVGPFVASSAVLGGRRVSFTYPRGALSEVVERYWWVEPGRPLTVHLWPGTGSEILWPDGPAVFASREGISPIEGPVLLGLRSLTARVMLAGATSLFAVRLRASALARLGVDATQYVDRPRPAPSCLLRKHVRDRSPRPTSLSEARAYVESTLRGLDDTGPLMRVASSIDSYYRAPATLTVPQAAELAALSQRQLRRDFLGAVGVGPKHFQRLVRFQRTLRSMLLDSPDAGGAQDLGYSDQSHQVREFTAFTGSTPSALRRKTPTHAYFPSQA